MALELGVSRREAAGLITALSYTVGMLTQETEATAEDFVAAASSRLISAPAIADIVRTIATQVVTERAELVRSIDHQRLAASVLPSLTAFDLAVDVRFKFED